MQRNFKNVQIYQVLRTVLFVVVSYVGVLYSAESSDQESRLFVWASVANLRQEPSTTVPIVDKLPIGTEVFVTTTREDWCHVRTKHYESEGWIRRDLLDSQAPTVSALVSKFELTPKEQIETRRMWAERLVALEPLDATHLDRLATVLQAENNSVLLEKVRSDAAFLRKSDNGSTNNFWVGILRDDGILTPVALYLSGKWTTPWPDKMRDAPKTSSENKKSALQSSDTSEAALALSELPRDWLGGTRQIPSQWYLWFREEPALVRVLKASVYPSHCSANWGLLTDHGEMSLQKGAPRPKLGVVASAKLNVSPIVKVAPDSAEALKVISLVVPAFNLAEATEINKLASKQRPVGKYLAYTGHPMATAERSHISMTDVSVLRAKSSVDSANLYFVSMGRRYPKPAGFADKECHGLTAFSGWLRTEKSENSTFSTKVVITDCDAKEWESEIPDAVISVENKNYLISENYGYEWEYYTIKRFTGSGLTLEVSRFAGGC